MPANVGSLAQHFAEMPKKQAGDLVTKAERYGTETAKVKRSAEALLSGNTKNLSSAWQQFQRIANPVVTECGVAWNPASTRWETSVGGKGLLFD
jgi:hypothetical protein